VSQLPEIGFRVGALNGKRPKRRLPPLARQSSEASNVSLIRRPRFIRASSLQVNQGQALSERFMLQRVLRRIPFLRRFFMTEIEAFLTRLRRIVADPARCEEWFARTAELFELFRKRLYDRHDVCSSKRPAFRDKEQVDRALADLRQLILRAEVAAEGNPRFVLTSVRHRIEMTRRALAALIPRDSPLNAGPIEEQRVDIDDQELISAIRQRALRNRQVVLNSLEAINQSRKLLRDRARQNLNGAFIA
jgi:hypothetical protein